MKDAASGILDVERHNANSLVRIRMAQNVDVPVLLPAGKSTLQKVAFQRSNALAGDLPFDFKSKRRLQDLEDTGGSRPLSLFDVGIVLMICGTHIGDRAACAEGWCQVAPVEVVLQNEDPA